MCLCPVSLCCTLDAIWCDQIMCQMSSAEAEQMWKCPVVLWWFVSVSWQMHVWCVRSNRTTEGALHTHLLPLSTQLLRKPVFLNSSLSCPFRNLDQARQGHSIKCSMQRLCITLCFRDGWIPSWWFSLPSQTLSRSPLGAEGQSH